MVRRPGHHGVVDGLVAQRRVSKVLRQKVKSFNRFASYTEYIGTNHVSPETGILDRFVLESVQPALGYDALTSSHPISIPVNHPNEISEIFDTISYLKVEDERHVPWSICLPFISREAQ